MVIVISFFGQELSLEFCSIGMGMKASATRAIKNIYPIKFIFAYSQTQKWCCFAHTWEVYVCWKLKGVSNK